MVLLSSVDKSKQTKNRHSPLRFRATYTYINVEHDDMHFMYEATQGI